jgi:hypothetical protein
LAAIDVVYIEACFRRAVETGYDPERGSAGD